MRTYDALIVAGVGGTCLAGAVAVMGILFFSLRLLVSALVLAGLAILSLVLGVSE